MEIYSSVSIRDRNLGALAIEMYKIQYGIAPTIMDEIFTLNNQDQYNLGNQTDFDVPKARSINHGSESVRYLGPKTEEINYTNIYKNPPATNLILPSKMESRFFSMQLM